MTRFTLHVPELYNDGREIPADTFDAIESGIVSIAEGFTMTRGVGAWRTYREPVRLYAIDTDAGDAAERLAAFAELIASELEQEAVYLTAQPLTVQLVTPASVTA